MFTNLGLVGHVKEALYQKWGYVYGTIGHVLTEQIITAKSKQYPDMVIPYLNFIRQNWLGRRTADCVCLIKSYNWWNGGNIKYSTDIDVSADGMYNRATTKGVITSMPDLPGICVHKKGHIGVYIGNGWVIEAHGTKSGVIRTPLNGSGSTSWTSWLQNPFIEYKSIAGLMWGDTGNIIISLQETLNKLGYNLAIDGSFGPETDRAVRNFQSQNNLEPSGVVDPYTNSALDAMIKRLTEPPKLTWQEILRSAGADPAWILGITTAVNAAEAEGSMGELEILKFLPELIIKIYYSKE